MRSSATIAALAALLLSGTATAADTPKAAKESGRPGAVLAEAECTKIWNDAAGRGDLTAENAALYVTNFEQVDTNGDSKISSDEFKHGCSMGFVQADAGGDASMGAGSGATGAE